jgi:hypothetical protein
VKPIPEGEADPRLGVAVNGSVETRSFRSWPLLISVDSETPATIAVRRADNTEVAWPLHDCKGGRWTVAAGVVEPGDYRVEASAGDSKAVARVTIAAGAPPADTMAKGFVLVISVAQAEGNAAEALKQAEAFVAAAPQRLVAHELYSSALADVGKTREALDAINRALELASKRVPKPYEAPRELLRRRSELEAALK